MSNAQHSKRWDYAKILSTYSGSNGDQTKALYAALCERGAAGVVAMNLFRACKCSARAKVYKGGIRGQGSYKSMAYDRKQWSIDNLAKALTDFGANLRITWGWAEDPAQPVHRFILYVDLPDGQVSFHTASRSAGPDYPGKWDGVRGEAPVRISKFCASLLERQSA